MSEKILVTGVAGQLGYDVIKRLKTLGIPCIGIDKEDLDLTDEQAVSDYIGELKPTGVIHCAAYTAVDSAEDNESVCKAVNEDATAYVAKACERVGAKLIYISTDYVYGGGGDEPFTPDSPVAPQSVYGRTKLGGEIQAGKYCSRLFVVRTSWVYGINGGNFVKTMLKLSDKLDTINVVNDQIGSPTYTVDLAVLLCDMILTEKYGTYHGTNENFCSWADFAQRIMTLAGKKTVINPIPTSEYTVSKAKRPLNSRMSKECLSKAGFSKLPTWENALERYIKELGVCNE